MDSGDQGRAPNDAAWLGRGGEPPRKLTVTDDPGIKWCSLCLRNARKGVRVSIADADRRFHAICSTCVRRMARYL